MWIGRAFDIFFAVLGIVLFSWISIKLGVANLPAQVGWKEIFAVSWLAGIGFTMSLFIAGIAFEEDALLSQAKIGILLASALASIIGLVLGFMLTNPIGKVRSAM